MLVLISDCDLITIRDKLKVSRLLLSNCRHYGKIKAQFFDIFLIEDLTPLPMKLGLKIMYVLIKTVYIVKVNRLLAYLSKDSSVEVAIQRYSFKDRLPNNDTENDHMLSHILFN